MAFDLEQIDKKVVNPLAGMSKYEIDRITSQELAEIVVSESLNDIDLPRVNSSLCFWEQIKKYVGFGYWKKVGPAKVEKVQVKEGSQVSSKEHIILSGPASERMLYHDDAWDTTEWKLIPDPTTVDVIRLRDLAHSEDVDTINKMGLVVSKLCIHVKAFCDEYSRRRGLEYKNPEGKVFKPTYRYDDVAKEVLKLVAKRMNIID